LVRMNAVGNFTKKALSRLAPVVRRTVSRWRLRKPNNDRTLSHR